MDLTYTKDYWFLILFVGTLIVTWVKKNATLTQHEKRITVIEAKVDANYELLQSIKLDVAVIRTKIEKK